jgi:hypothetical protein
MTEPISLQAARAEVWRTKRQEALVKMMKEVDYLHHCSRKRIQDIAACYLPQETQARVVKALKQMTKSTNEATDVLQDLIQQFSETRPPVL